MRETHTGEIAEIVKALLEHDPAEWPPLLSSYPPETRTEVESLLRFQKLAENFLPEPAAHLAAEMLVDDATLEPGTRVQHYEIQSLIGTGGMGEVYLATDTKLKRQVALKLVQRGINSQVMLRRFRQEKEILASLNHPNIAQLYGSGMTADGTPFFVMEYVPGSRVDEFCDAHALRLRERLDLFRKICAAVTYAHQRLVIHRDLKPANVRVTDDGEPKLLDFGIAKVLDDAAAPDALEQTLTLQRVMTPEYASPEQVRGEAMTTASDVYSLGVILYELLTAQKPYLLKARTTEEISRAITEQNAPRPSLTAPLHAKQLRGDLDNIVLMALRKEPARRYASVAQFSDDIRRYLEGRPVVARKDTLSYRAGKFVRRNRVAVGAAALVLISIFAGLIVAISTARIAQRQRDLAQHERNKAERINTFLNRMLSFSNQSITSVSPSAQRPDVTVNEMLDQITPQVDKELADEPEVRAGVLRTIGSAYASRGQYEGAEKNLRDALDVQNRLHAEATAESAATMLELGVLEYRRENLGEADRILTSAATFYRAQHQTQSAANDPGKLALALDYLGVVKAYEADLPAAVRLLREALTVSSTANLPPNEQWVIAFNKSDLGGYLSAVGQRQEGEQLVRDAISSFSQISGPPRWELGTSLMLLGTALLDRGEYQQAVEAFEQSEKILRMTLGDSNFYLVGTLDGEAKALSKLNSYQQAEEKARAAIEMARALSPSRNVSIAGGLWTLGDILTAAGRLAEGEASLRQALQIYSETSLIKLAAGPFASLSRTLAAERRWPEAMEAAEQAYAIAKQTLGEKNAVTVSLAKQIESLRTGQAAAGSQP